MPRRNFRAVSAVFTGAASAAGCVIPAAATTPAPCKKRRRVQADMGNSPWLIKEIMNKSRYVRRLAENLAKQLNGVGINARTFTFSRPRHVQYPNPVIVGPSLHNGGKTLVVQIDHQTRFFQAPCQFDGQRRTAAGPAARQNQGAVRIADIPFRPLRIRTIFRFLERIPLRNGAIFRPPAPGTPTST